MMQSFTKDVKFMPLRVAASLAASRRLHGIRIVTGAVSPSARKAWISDGVAPFLQQFAVLHVTSFT